MIGASVMNVLKCMKKNFMTPSYEYGLLLQGCRTTTRRKLSFKRKVSRDCGTHLINLRETKD